MFQGKKILKGELEHTYELRRDNTQTTACCTHHVCHFFCYFWQSPSNTSDLVWARQEKLCSKQLEPLLVRLSTRFNDNPTIPLSDQTKIVELLTLCSSEHPEFRHKIGTFEEGVALKAIVDLLKEDKDSVTAVVGNAIWILSFDDKFNHNYFVEHALESMASILVERAKTLEQADDKQTCALTVMWMAAALQNLAASYCETDSGHCWWEYDFPEEEDATDYGIYLHEESPLVVDAAEAAEKIVKAAGGELVTVLHRLVCEDPMTSEDEQKWASEATIDGSVHPRIITWAVAGLLKNLSMYDGSYEATMAAKDCLCALTQSEDWLVSSLLFILVSFLLFSSSCV